MLPIICNLHNKQVGPNSADRRFTLNITFLLAATHIEEAKQEALRYIDEIKDHAPSDWWWWDQAIGIIEDGRFVHNLRKK